MAVSVAERMRPNMGKCGDCDWHASGGWCWWTTGVVMGGPRTLGEWRAGAWRVLCGVQLKLFRPIVFRSAAGGLRDRDGALVGTCEDMCPLRERERRENLHDIQVWLGCPVHICIGMRLTRWRVAGVVFEVLVCGAGGRRMGRAPIPPWWRLQVCRCPASEEQAWGCHTLDMRASACCVGLLRYSSAWMPRTAGARVRSWRSDDLRAR